MEKSHPPQVSWPTKLPFRARSLVSSQPHICSICNLMNLIEESVLQSQIQKHVIAMEDENLKHCCDQIWWWLPWPSMGQRSISQESERPLGGPAELTWNSKKAKTKPKKLDSMGRCFKKWTHKIEKMAEHVWARRRIAKCQMWQRKVLYQYVSTAAVDKGYGTSE